MQELIGFFYKIQPYIINYMINIIGAVAILIVGRYVSKILAKLAQRAMHRANVNLTIASFIKNIIYFGLLLLVFIAALHQLGIETNSFIAVIGAAGLAIGLALQGSLSNFAAGIMMILFRPFELGNQIEAGGASGTVEEMQIFSTILRTAEGKKVIIPNAKITGDKIIVHNPTDVTEI
jgi:small conductance mechanosensitive channel